VECPVVDVLHNDLVLSVALMWASASTGSTFGLFVGWDDVVAGERRYARASGHTGDHGEDRQELVEASRHPMSALPVHPDIPCEIPWWRVDQVPSRAYCSVIANHIHV